MRRGEVVVLSANTADALIAYIAGPKHVQRVPRVDHAVREQVDDGPWTRRPPSEQERAEVQETLEAFFGHLGLPAPPQGEEWRLHLPEGVTEEAFRDSLADPAIPAFDGTNEAMVVEMITKRLEHLLGPID